MLSKENVVHVLRISRGSRSEFTILPLNALWHGELVINNLNLVLRTTVPEALRFMFALNIYTCT
jgi:hypothetical protein